MRWDDYATIVLILAALIFFICLKTIQKKHAENPHFKEEEERRKEEYRRKTAEANREKALRDAIDEGYSYGDIPDEDDEDDS